MTRPMVCSVTCILAAISRWESGPVASTTSTGTEAWVRPHRWREASHARSTRRAAAESRRPVGHVSGGGKAAASRCSTGALLLRVCRASPILLSVLSVDGGRRTRPAHKDASRRGSVLRALLLALVLAGWLAAGAFGGMAQGTLSQVQENDQAAFLPASAESTRASELAAEFTEGEPLPALVVLEPTGGGEITPAHVAAAEAFAAAAVERELPDGQVVG